MEPIRIIVVGCGFAGLACAIESKRKGHDVILLEKYSQLDILGDVISFAPNSGRIFERWGLGDSLMDICTQHPFMHIHNLQGDLLYKQPLPQKSFGSNCYNGRRGEIHDVLLKHAIKLGVDVRFGYDAKEYWEDADHAGVVVDGQRLVADVVVAADGVHSKARKAVLGEEDKPISTGYAIYRAWCKAKDQGIDTDSLTKWICENGGEFYTWMGADTHLLAMAFHNGEDICWCLTHKDEFDIEESWSLPGKIEDVLQLVKDWDPRCAALISRTPTCVDWKLVNRKPLPKWTSESGRVVLIGDAAHPFLPTSVQGASQGVEDGVTLASTLKLAGKEDIPLATAAMQRIRYDRVVTAQKMGESNRDKWHNADAEAKGEEVELPFPEWLLSFDAEKHTLEVFEHVKRAILEGRSTSEHVQ